MKPKLLLILFSFFLLCIHPYRGVATPVTSFLMLRGKAGSESIVFYLYKYDQYYSGYYYFESQQRPYIIAGIDSSQTGKLHLSTSTKRYKEFFVLTQNDHHYRGLMTRENEKGRNVQLELRRVTPALRMNYLYEQDSVKLLNEESPYPSATVGIGLVWPEERLPGFTTMKQGLSGFVKGFEYAEGDIRLQMQKLIQKELDSYKNDYYYINEQELKRAPRSYSVEIRRTIHIAHQTHRFISFVYSDYQFSGGAHGITQLKYFTWDRKAGKALMLQELFDQKAMDSLMPVLAKRYLSENGYDPGTPLYDAGLFENTLVESPSSVYLTDKGMIFHYNPATIAAYSTGMIDIFVPFQELRLLLQVPLLKSLGWDELQPLVE
ncbi:MAG: DUF4163 domain-containing protein [Bacteroidetes bacterium]|nr:DUF4163 domain-containing protein [Bacteroidota bacterium]